MMDNPLLRVVIAFIIVKVDRDMSLLRPVARTGKSRRTCISWQIPSHLWNSLMYAIEEWLLKKLQIAQNVSAGRGWRHDPRSLITSSPCCVSFSGFLYVVGFWTIWRWSSSTRSTGWRTVSCWRLCSCLFSRCQAAPAICWHMNTIRPTKRQTRLKLDKRAFAVSVAVTWNSLPANLRTVSFREDICSESCWGLFVLRCVNGRFDVY